MLATSTVRSSTRPAWQTEELEDEWIEPPSDSHDNHFPVSENPPLTDSPPSSSRHQSVGRPQSPPTTPGTFLIREDQPVASILPEPLRKSRKKGIMKDFFSPLALETMFEPPSPRSAEENLPPMQSHPIRAHTPGDEQGDKNEDDELDTDNGLGEGDMEEETRNGDPDKHEPCEDGDEDVILASDIPNLVSFDGRKPSSAYKFTFAVPQSSHGTNANTEGTPCPSGGKPRGPHTDPRLRLFQFQYDTYTRDHLSAMVDSIAIHAPSSNATKDTSPPDRGTAATPTSPDNVGYLRATKRLKLTPPQDVSNTFSVPRTRRDYVGESRKLMQKIRQARSSSMTTIFSVKENIQPTTVEDHSTVEDRPRRLPPGNVRSVWSSETPSEISNPPDANSINEPSSTCQPSAASLRPVYPTSTLSPSLPSSLYSSTSNSQSKTSRSSSALGYRRRAADLMAQIREDMTTGKRLISLEVPKDERVEEESSSPALQSKPAQTTISSREGDKTEGDKLLFPVVHKVPKPSPRKLLRRLSAADEVDRELALTKTTPDTSLVAQGLDSKYIPAASPAPQLQQPAIHAFHVSSPAPDPRFLLPQLPTSGGRVVSGGTTTSTATTETALTQGTTATTVSAGSVGSFVKHPGPAQIMRIAPGDVPILPEMVGGMKFDRALMRWVKEEIEGDGGGPLEDSDDPFKSFESLDTGKGDENEPQADQKSTAEVRENASLVKHGDEETDDSFEFDDGPSVMGIVEIMTGVSSGDTDTGTSDSETDDVQPEVLTNGVNPVEEEREETNAEDTTIPARAPPAPALDVTPVPAHRDAHPPRSALKNGSSAQSHNSPAGVTALRTPKNLFIAAHRRSVSFSDGRKDGKIRGLGRNNSDGANGPSPLAAAAADATSKDAVFVPSARGDRIAAALEDLVEPIEEQTPSKGSTTSRPLADALQPLASRPQSQPPSAARRVFARSHKGTELSLVQGNQTLLTECSFGVAQDKLVQAITDVHPYVPYWETLADIDLREKGLDSVVRLKEFLPQLDKLRVDTNLLPWLTGVPKTVRSLSVTSNLLTAMTSFSHLTNLENLDISNNEIDSLQQLSCLRHLRELKADGNKIEGLDGLGGLDGLAKLSLKGNRIREVDLKEIRWPRLETLNLSRNEIRVIAELSSLDSLTALNLDHNRLERIETDRKMTKLRTLRVSDNRLVQLDVSCLPGLRTLYADNNRLSELRGLKMLRKLENLSLRNQGSKGVALVTREMRDIKRLYLSGNPLVSNFIQEPCYNLVYLEVAACRLAGLPPDLARMIPNVRVLNLNYNFLTDVRALDGLTRLRKLTLIGSRLAGTKSLLRMLRRMPEIEMLDCRMNPCTLGWYLPILVHGVPGALQPSEDEPGGGKKVAVASGGESWQELDAKFRRGLPDAAYVGRLAYRGLVMRACPQVRMLDGVAVERGERDKAARLLAGVLNAAGESAGKAA